MKPSETLKLLAPMYGFYPEEWHYRLADLTTAMTVIGVFQTARFEMGLFSEMLVIEDEIIREKAKRWMREVARARGVAVTLHEPATIRDRDAPGVFMPPEAEIRKLPIKQPRIRVDRRTTPEFREGCRVRMMRQHLERRLIKSIEVTSDTP